MCGADRVHLKHNKCDVFMKNLYVAIALSMRCESKRAGGPRNHGQGHSI